jgi:hypothetical protein
MDIANITNLLLSRIRRLERRLTNFQNIPQEEKKKEYVWRSFNGTGNNLFNPSWGSSNTTLLRKLPSEYKDRESSLAERGTSNPNPRLISNNICAIQEGVEIEKNEFNLSDMIWVWGQFLDHEMDLTESNSEEKANIIFEDKIISFNRSISVPNIRPRQHPNQISSFIDASNVYGSNLERAYALRRLDGTGKMKTSENNLLPLNEENLENASLPSNTNTELFLAGDIRANENILLTSIHTIFVREHNRLCDVIVQNDSSLEGKDEIIFQTARRIVIGLMQRITYREFLPALLGRYMFSSYTFYNSTINPTITTEFSTFGFRLGHSMISSNILDTETGENIQLKDAFFNPEYVKTNGISGILKGISDAKMKKINNFIIDDLRNFLFGSPQHPNLHDLASLNIQRGRDHGIPGYNKVRKAYGLAEKKSFAEITSDTTLQQKLSETYNSVNDIDPWIGCLCEDHLPGAPVGELIIAILREQFRRLRDGDRFWYQNDENLSSFELDIINNSTLGEVLTRNTDLNFSENVFYV